MRKVLLAGAAAVSVAAAHGIEEPPDTVGTIAITGGTGAYRSARGQIHFRDTRRGRPCCKWPSNGHPRADPPGRTDPNPGLGHAARRGVRHGPVPA
jgi:hypothetical protein